MPTSEVAPAFTCACNFISSPPVWVAVIGGLIAGLIHATYRRWLELSASRPKAAAEFIKRIDAAEPKPPHNGNEPLTDFDIASFKGHLWPWQVNRLSSLYSALVQAESKGAQEHAKRLSDIKSHIKKFL